MEALVERVRGVLLRQPHVQAVSHLDVHSETATSRLLHVHARLVLDPAIELRAGLVSLRTATAAVEALRMPVYTAPAAAAAASAAGETKKEEKEEAWSVVEADVSLETQSP